MINWTVLLGILIPLIGTTIGAATVFFLRKNIGRNAQNLLLGLASGVMIAASVWSLLIPAIELSPAGALAWLPASVGFLSGIAFLIALDAIFPKIHKNLRFSNLGVSKQNFMLFFAITLHNIPEGMAVGVAFAGAISGSAELTFAGAYVLSIGIALQNFPEGAILSLPLKASGHSKKRSFLFGFVSGVVEPLAALITILLTSLITPLLPYLLAFAGGTMVYVVVTELIPEIHEGRRSFFGITGVAVGFVIMMILDVALSGNAPSA